MASNMAEFKRWLDILDATPEGPRREEVLANIITVLAAAATGVLPPGKDREAFAMVWSAFSGGG